MRNKYILILLFFVYSCGQKQYESVLIPVEVSNVIEQSIALYIKQEMMFLVDKYDAGLITSADKDRLKGLRDLGEYLQQYESIRNEYLDTLSTLIEIQTTDPTVTPYELHQKLRNLVLQINQLILEIKNSATNLGWKGGLE